MVTCGYKHCGDIDKSDLIVTCSSSCGKVFHPSCAGLSKNASRYVKEYLEFFSFKCPECSVTIPNDLTVELKNKDSIINALFSSIRLIENKMIHEFKMNSEKYEILIQGIDGLSSSIDKIILDNNMGSVMNINNKNKDFLNKIEDKIEEKINNIDAKISLKIEEVTNCLSKFHTAINSLTKVPLELDNINCSVNGIADKLQLISSLTLSLTNSAESLSINSKKTNELEVMLQQISNDVGFSKSNVEKIVEECNITNAKIDTALSSSSNVAEKTLSTTLYDELLETDKTMVTSDLSCLDNVTGTNSDNSSKTGKLNDTLKVPEIQFPPSLLSQQCTSSFLPQFYRTVSSPISYSSALINNIDVSTEGIVKPTSLEPTCDSNGKGNKDVSNIIDPEYILCISNLDVSTTENQLESFIKYK